MPQRTDPVASPKAEDVLAHLGEILAAVLDPEDAAKVELGALNLQTPLLSLPIDSLKLMELMTQIEDRFRIYIPEEEAYAFATLGEVVAFVQQRVAAKSARQQG
jgi:acyl carrier protein